ncbi:MAG: hypothetical protein IT378_27295, partial [Sandaracinaceae bacterium]|nr:hypothetical protein [Sandaracinaceae bacterium]
MAGRDWQSVALAFHAASIGEGRWSDALEGFRRVLGSSGAVLELHDLKAGVVPLFEHAGMPDEAWPRYVAHYHRVNPRVAVLRTMGVGVTSHDRTFFSERAMDRAEFYADFLAPWGFRYYFGAPLANDPGRLALITVQRSPAEGTPGSQDEEVYDRLFPHVRQALEVHARLRASELRAAVAEHAIDRVALGMVWLDARGRVLLANRAALRLAAGGALAISGARLRVEDPSSRAALDRAI